MKARDVMTSNGDPYNLAPFRQLGCGVLARRRWCVDTESYINRFSSRWWRRLPADLFWWTLGALTHYGLWQPARGGYYWRRGAHPTLPFLQRQRY